VAGSCEHDNEPLVKEFLDYLSKQLLKDSPLWTWFITTTIIPIS